MKKNTRSYRTDSIEKERNTVVTLGMSIKESKLSSFEPIRARLGLARPV